METITVTYKTPSGELITRTYDGSCREAALATLEAKIQMGWAVMSVETKNIKLTDEPPFDLDVMSLN